MSQNLLPIGTFVDHHNGHGYGKIVAYNEHNDGLYPAIRYMYIVEYLTGYKDVYAPSDFVVVPEDEVNEIRRFFGESK